MQRTLITTADLNLSGRVGLGNIRVLKDTEACRPEVICQVGQCALCLPATSSTLLHMGKAEKMPFLFPCHSRTHPKKNPCPPLLATWYRNIPRLQICPHLNTVHVQTGNACPVLSFHRATLIPGCLSKLLLLPACSSEPAEHSIQTSAFGIQSTEPLLCGF